MRTTFIDVGASRVICATFSSVGKDRLRLDQIGSAACNPEPTSEARWNDGVAKAIAEVAARQAFPAAAKLGVPGHLALTKFIKTPAVEESKRSKIVQFEATQNIPYPLSEVVWDHAVVGRDQMDLDVMLVAAKAEAAEDLCSGAAASGFKVDGVTPGCVALGRAFRYNYPEVHDNVLLIAIGARSTHLLFLGPAHFHLRSITLAGNGLTQAIAEVLGLDFAPAESLKRQVLSGAVDLPALSPARRAVEDAAANFCTRLQIEITRSVVSFRRHTGQDAPVAIYCTGGGAKVPLLAKSLADKLLIPVMPFDALRRVEVAPGAAAAREEGAALAELVGLAAPLAGIQFPDASLLPADRKQRARWRRQQPWLLGAAALLALSALPPWWHYHQAVVTARAQLARLESDLRPVRLLRDRNTGNLERIAQARQQIEALRGLVASKSNWINFLSDLQSRLGTVEDVWLDKLSVTRPPPAPSGSGDASDRPGLHLTLSGRLLDKNNPVSKVSVDSYARVKSLLESFTSSTFIAAVQNERFDNAQPGILRFDFTLIVNPDHPL